MHWKMCIIELSKLVYDRDTNHYHLKKLFRKINDAVHNEKLDLEYSIIKGWKKELNSRQPLILNINIRRNKFYAHTDNDKSIYLDTSEIEFSEMLKLIEVTELIVKDIYTKVLDTAYMQKDLHFKKRALLKL